MLVFSEPSLFQLLLRNSEFRSIWTSTSKTHKDIFLRSLLYKQKDCADLVATAPHYLRIFFWLTEVTCNTNSPLSLPLSLLFGACFSIWLYRNAYSVLSSCLRYFTSQPVIYDSLLLTSLGSFVSDDFTLSLESLIAAQYSIRPNCIGPRNTFFDDDFLFPHFVIVT